MCQQHQEDKTNIEVKYIYVDSYAAIKEQFFIGWALPAKVSGVSA